MFEGIQRGQKFSGKGGSLSSSSVTSASLIQIKNEKYEQPPVSNALRNTYLSRGNFWNKMADILEFQVKPGGLDQK